jgi:AAA15 family ATPase/GTPase
VLTQQAESERVLIRTAHKIFNQAGEPISSVNFSLQQDESDGTEKLFYLTGPLVDVLAKGSVLVIDEMEARLHPMITRALIGLFNSKETNPQNAQVIFTTHDTNLLSNKAFRRDQIWFTEKDRYGCSHLYSLAELKVRNDASYEDDYLDGRYGAIPFLGNVRHVMIEE